MHHQVPKNSVAKFFFTLKEGLWETEIKIQVFWSALVLFLTPFCKVYYLVLHPVETANCKLEERRGDGVERDPSRPGPLTDRETPGTGSLRISICKIDLIIPPAERHFGD